MASPPATANRKLPTSPAQGRFQPSRARKDASVTTNTAARAPMILAAGGTKRTAKAVTRTRAPRRTTPFRVTLPVRSRPSSPEKRKNRWRYRRRE